MNAHIKRQTMICAALAVAVHAGQFRRDKKTDYYEGHVKKVAQQFSVENEWREHCAAQLHDVIEDSNTTEQDLLNLGVDKEVIAAVVVLTKNKGQDYTEYIKKVKSNKIARRVKIADIFANINDAPTKKQKAKYLKALSILC